MKKLAILLVCLTGCLEENILHGAGGDIQIGVCSYCVDGALVACDGIERDDVFAADVYCLVDGESRGLCAWWPEDCE
jgi:hypothetical protein